MVNDYARLFDAIQKSFEPKDMTEESIFDWLVHGTRTSGKEIKGKSKEGKIIYRDKPLEGSAGKRRIARTLAETRKVYTRIEDARTLEELDKLKSEAQSLTVHSNTLLRYIDRRSEPLEEERANITSQAQKLEDRVVQIRELPIEEQRQMFKSGATREERELAAVAIREVSPQRLGGLIRGERAAGIRALRTVFND